MESVAHSGNNRMSVLYSMCYSFTDYSKEVSDRLRESPKTHVLAKERDSFHS